jgi:hypothetical protein
METPPQTFARLLAALEELAACESIQVAAGDHAGTLRTQQRASSVVERLAELGPDAADAPARARLAALLCTREIACRGISTRIECLRGELARVRLDLRRLMVIGFFHQGGGNRPAGHQLTAQG